MVGKYSIEIYNNKLHYKLEIKRNITIIQGNSATGKTTLINLVSEYARLGKGSGITLNCEKECLVLPFVRWREFMKETKDSIIFVEENMPFIRTKEFAECLNYSDNYYVIIYRDSLPQLSYSVEEIYGIKEDRESQKYIKANRVYESLYNIYSLRENIPVKPDIVITEDANSGHEFFDALFECECVASEGKSTVHKLMSESAFDGKTVLGIVDGAAFGSDIQKSMRTIANKQDKCCLYAPESFEYLILKSGLIKCDLGVIDQTYDYADSTKYISWEQFYTDKLSEETRNTNHQYSKTRLNDFYKSRGFLKKVMDIMTGIES